jgi:transcriptional regulator with XRE-family HTH domain
MVKLTSLKLRRMSLGVRQIDVSVETGITPSRYSLIENELVQPKPQEVELIEEFLTAVQKHGHDSRAPRREVRMVASP